MGSTARHGRLVGAAVALVAFLALAARQAFPPAPPAKPAPPAPALQTVEPAIVSLDLDPPLATVWTDVKGAPDLAANIDIAARQLGTVARALKAGVSDDLRGIVTVRYRPRADATNRFDRDLRAPLLTVEMPLAALKAAAGLPDGRILGLATRITLDSPGTYDAVAAWCKTPRADPAFCAKAPR